jgi:hypothetical protein
MSAQSAASRNNAMHVEYVLGSTEASLTRGPGAVAARGTECSYRLLDSSFAALAPNVDTDCSLIMGDQTRGRL